MEILHTFGVDPILLIAQLINFGIILFVLKKFLYKPVMTMLKERREEIKKGVADAERANQLLEEASEKEKTILRNAQSETKKLLDDARKQAEHILVDAKEASRKETEKMLKDAKEQILFESKAAEKRLATHISQLAIAMLTKSLSSVVTEDEQTAIVKEATKRFQGKVN